MFVHVRIQLLAGVNIDSAVSVVPLMYDITMVSIYVRKPSLMAHLVFREILIQSIELTVAPRWTLTSRPVLQL